MTEHLRAAPLRTHADLLTLLDRAAPRAAAVEFLLHGVVHHPRGGRLETDPHPLVDLLAPFDPETREVDPAAPAPPAPPRAGAPAPGQAPAPGDLVVRLRGEPGLFAALRDAPPATLAGVDVTCRDAAGRVVLATDAREGAAREHAGS